jgi:hypothetical protein
MLRLAKFLHGETGRILMSIILGLGLASLFRKVCKDRDCISFNGPVIGDIDGKIYQYGEKCYQYQSNAESCDQNKRIVDIDVNAHVSQATPPSIFK